MRGGAAGRGLRFLASTWLLILLVTSGKFEADANSSVYPFLCRVRRGTRRQANKREILLILSNIILSTMTQSDFYVVCDRWRIMGSVSLPCQPHFIDLTPLPCSIIPNSTFHLICIKLKPVPDYGDMRIVICEILCFHIKPFLPFLIGNCAELEWKSISFQF